MRKARASLWMIAATICTVTVLFVLPITPKVAVSTAVIPTGELLLTLSAEALVSYDGELPIAAFSTGQVAEVCVSAGQRVREGELLLSLDTTAEEAALARLSAMRQSQNAALNALSDDTLRGAASAQGVELALQIEQTKAAIELKRLRAPSDGVVEQVYAREGGVAVAEAPLLLLRGDALMLTASVRVKDGLTLEQGMRAAVSRDGDVVATATLDHFEAPAESGGQLRQSVCFRVDEPDALAVGEAVQLDILRDARQDVALVPISAVDENDRIWLVRDGKAASLTIDASERSAELVAVPKELAGERVVLLPKKLYDGCAVKEAKR